MLQRFGDAKDATQRAFGTLMEMGVEKTGGDDDDFDWDGHAGEESTGESAAFWGGDGGDGGEEGEDGEEEEEDGGEWEEGEGEEEQEPCAQPLVSNGAEGVPGSCPAKAPAGAGEALWGGPVEGSAPEDAGATAGPCEDCGAVAPGKIDPDDGAYYCEPPFPISANLRMDNLRVGVSFSLRSEPQDSVRCPDADSPAQVSGVGQRTSHHRITIPPQPSRATHLP